MQAVLFEIQLIRSRSANPSGKGKSAKVYNQFDSDKSLKSPEQVLELEAAANSMSRRGSHGVKSILLKGEMRCVRDINMLVFLCSPL